MVSLMFIDLSTISLHKYLMREKGRREWKGMEGGSTKGVKKRKKRRG